jgi:hypothetical protein
MSNIKLYIEKDGEYQEIGHIDSVAVEKLGSMGKPVSMSIESNPYLGHNPYTGTIPIEESRFAHDHTSNYLSQWFNRVTAWY